MGLLGIDAFCVKNLLACLARKLIAHCEILNGQPDMLVFSFSYCQLSAFFTYQLSLPISFLYLSAIIS